MANFCTNCGSKLQEESKHCAMCGTAVVSGQEQQNDVMSKITRQINELAGGKGSVKLKIGDLFTDVFKKHSGEEAAEVFTSGTVHGTPKDNEISSSWPKPWLYTRALLMFAVTFFILLFCYIQFENDKMLPGVFFMGAIMMPLALLIFFAEINAPRNISFYTVMKMFFVGGAGSLLITLFLYKVITLSDDLYFQAIMIGIIEEVGKAAIVIYYISKSKDTKYALNGMLIGAAVGAGFAAFETAGYIFENLLIYGYSDMIDTIYIRTILAPGGHIAWAAIYGTALMLVKKNKKFDMSMVFTGRFMSFFFITVVLHSIWDMPIKFGASIALVQDILVITAWIIILVLIQVGLNQISNNEFVINDNNQS